MQDRGNTIIRATVTSLVVLVALSAAQAAGASEDRLIQIPPEPSPEEIYAAAGVDPDDPHAIWHAALTLLARHPGAVDVRLPELQRGEMGGAHDQSAAEGTSRREADPARQLDLLLRRLGELGEPQQLPLFFATYARTPWGRWKAYAATQEIMARSAPANVLREAGRIGSPDPATLATLAFDLEPPVAAAYGRLIREQVEANRPGTRAMSPGVLDVWLAWTLAEADPDAAAELFGRVLQSHDPALRLAGGSGLMALGRSVPPFRLTAPPEQTKPQRETWLSTLTPWPLDPFWRPDPLARPFVQVRRGGRIDLVWLNERAEEVRRVDDVWPTVRSVLPDGTFWSLLPTFDWETFGLTSPSGEVYARLHDVGYFSQQPLPHGGLLVLTRQQGGHFEEHLPWGGPPLWALPADDVRIAPIGRGRFLVSGRQGVRILDRRGDVVATVPIGEGGVIGDRHIELVDPDTVLLANQTTIELRKLDGELLQRHDGFTSIVDVRYQPNGPWVVLDKGTIAVVLHPTTSERFEFDLSSSNDDPPLYSRWKSPNDAFPK